MQSHRLQPLMIVLVLMMQPMAIRAQEAGTNITKETGLLSNLSGGPSTEEVVELRVPQQGREYEIKVNFLKIEDSSAALDAYIDFLNEQAKKRGETVGSNTADATREMLKSLKSRADFEVHDSSGNLVGKVSDLGALTFFKTVTFKAKAATYKVKVKCLSGAGLYHLTFEYN